VDAIGGARRLRCRLLPGGCSPVHRVVVGPAPAPVRFGVLKGGRALRCRPPVRRGSGCVPTGVHRDPRAGTDDQTGHLPGAPRTVR